MTRRPGAPTAAAVLRDLRAEADAGRAAALQRFFRTGVGEYGEGDRFLGIPVPRLRVLSRAHAELGPDGCRTLLASPAHEARRSPC